MAERLDAITYQYRRDQADWTSNRQRIPTNGRPQDGPTPMELSAITHPPPRRFEKLTPQLRAQLIREGKCLYCREPGHMAMDCPKKKMHPNGHRP
jgi:hypothetical protein